MTFIERKCVYSGLKFGSGWKQQVFIKRTNNNFQICLFLLFLVLSFTSLCFKRKLSWFKHHVFSRCFNVGCWIRIRNIHFDGIMLPIGCRPSKLHIVFKVSVAPSIVRKQTQKKQHVFRHTYKHTHTNTHFIHPFPSWKFKIFRSF